MLKTKKITETGKRFSSKKLKVVARDGWVYDFEWRLGFKDENYRQEFINKIKRAQEQIKEGKCTPMEDFAKEMEEWMNSVN